MDKEIDVQQRCLELVKNTGYEIIQSNGQRVYKQPNEKLKPLKGSEIFVGKLPRDLFEDELVPLFSKIGQLHQVRLMMDFSGNTRGFCFITYYVPEHADDAVTILNGFEIRPRRRIGVHKSINNCRLFVGGIPVDKTCEEVREGFSQYVNGIMEVIMYPSRENRQLNRGYAFLEFETHRDAAMARRNLSPGRLIMWNVTILVDWAEPVPEVDANVMAQVKKLYLRNLDTNLTATELCNFLVKFVPANSIAKIYKNWDYAFVHFTQRKIAEYCMNILKGKFCGGSEIVPMWARPRIYSKVNRVNLPSNHFCKSLPPKWTNQMANKSDSSTDSSTDFFSASTWSNDDTDLYF